MAQPLNVLDGGRSQGVGGGFAFRVCRFLPSRCDEEIFRVVRNGSAREALLGDFLSKWLIHKMPPLPSPEATVPCQVLLHPWGVAFKSGGGAQAMKGARSLICSALRVCMMEIAWVSQSLRVSCEYQNLPRVFGQPWE